MLTITIPSARGPAALLAVLDGLQVVRHEGVELCAFVNGSADYSESDFVKLRSCADTVDISEAQVGIDASMLRALQLGSRPWVWGLGDDDIVDSLAVNTVKGILSTGSRITPTLIAFVGDTPDQFRIASTADASAKWFRCLALRMPFGAVVLPRPAIKAAVAHKYEGTSHAYAGLAWEWVLANRDVLDHHVRTLPRGLICSTDDEKTYSDRWKQVHLEDIPKWFSLLPEELGTKVVFEEYVQEQTSFGALSVLGRISPRELHLFFPTSRVRRLQVSLKSVLASVVAKALRARSKVSD